MRAGYKIAAAGLFVALGCVLAFSGPHLDATDASTANVSAAESSASTAGSDGRANSNGSTSVNDATGSAAAEASSSVVVEGDGSRAFSGGSSAGSAAESVSGMIADRAASSVAAEYASSASAEDGSASYLQTSNESAEASSTGSTATTATTGGSSSSITLTVVGASNAAGSSSASDENGASDESEGQETHDASAETSAEPVTYRDGTYRSAAEGKLGSVPVTVVVDGGRISSVTVGANSEVAQMINKAEETVIPQILENQSVEGVETATGATISSTAIIEAVADIISRATVE